MLGSGDEEWKVEVCQDNENHCFQMVGHTPWGGHGWALCAFSISFSIIIFLWSDASLFVFVASGEDIFSLSFSVISQELGFSACQFTGIRIKKKNTQEMNQLHVSAFLLCYSPNQNLKRKRAKIMIWIQCCEGQAKWVTLAPKQFSVLLEAKCLVQCKSKKFREVFKTSFCCEGGWGWGAIN